MFSFFQSESSLCSKSWPHGAWWRFARPPTLGDNSESRASRRWRSLPALLLEWSDAGVAPEVQQSQRARRACAALPASSRWHMRVTGSRWPPVGGRDALCMAIPTALWRIPPALCTQSGHGDSYSRMADPARIEDISRWRSLARPSPARRQTPEERPEHTSARPSRRSLGGPGARRRPSSSGDLGRAATSGVAAPSRFGSRGPPSSHSSLGGRSSSHGGQRGDLGSGAADEPPPLMRRSLARREGVWRTDRCGRSMEGGCRPHGKSSCGSGGIRGLRKRGCRLGYPHRGQLRRISSEGRARGSGKALAKLSSDFGRSSRSRPDPADLGTAKFVPVAAHVGPNPRSAGPKPGRDESPLLRVSDHPPPPPPGGPRGRGGGASEWAPSAPVFLSACWQKFFAASPKLPAANAVVCLQVLGSCSSSRLLVASTHNN